jgi:hypothetical protein
LANPADRSLAVDPGVAGELARSALATARRFAAGATMWCLAPAWLEHARHVAVEFVHPVIVGKRALPAVAVDDPDPITALRSLARTGDVLVAVSDRDSRPVIDAMRRAPAWGLTSLWIGTGPRPPTGVADHLLWLDQGEGSARHDGALVLMYHVLWELTHVCFEHPGLLTASANEPRVDEVACITCSDEGRPAEVVSAPIADVAAVRSARGLERVDTTLVGDVVAGDLVLVHAGTAIAVLEETRP